MGVAEAAIEIIPVERTRHAPEPENAAFESRFGSPERNPFLGWNPDPYPLSHYRVDDVVLDGRFRGLFNAQGFLQGTGYLVPDEHMMTHAVDAAQLVRQFNDRVVIIGCNVAYENYFHWMTQCLPAIDTALSRDGQDHRASVALPALTEWQQESLLLLGYGGVRRVIIDDNTRQYLFARVEYSEILRGETTFRSSGSLARTFTRLRNAVEQLPRESRKLYVARTDSASRRMRNEDILIEELRRRGYEIVVPGEFGLADQIRMFRNASLVVGPHGAGLTNIAFCEPGAVIYELVPGHFTNACFRNLAHIARLHYWADAFDSPGDGFPNLRDWESDTALVLERLDEIEANHTELEEEAHQRVISAMDFLRGRSGQVPAVELPDEAAVPEQGPRGLRRLWRRLFARSAA